MVSAQSKFTETRYYIKKSAGVGKAALQLRDACRVYHYGAFEPPQALEDSAMLYAFGLAHSESIPKDSVSSSTRKTFAIFRAIKITSDRPPLQQMTKATSARFAPIASPVVMYLTSPSSS